MTVEQRGTERYVLSVLERRGDVPTEAFNERFVCIFDTVGEIHEWLYSVADQLEPSLWLGISKTFDRPPLGELPGWVKTFFASDPTPQPSEGGA
jgi:hypothetical protein